MTHFRQFCIVCTRSPSSPPKAHLGPFPGRLLLGQEIKNHNVSRQPEKKKKELNDNKENKIKKQNRKIIAYHPCANLKTSTYSVTSREICGDDGRR